MREGARAFLSLLFWASGMSAQNLILNPDFDSKFLHWNPFADVGGTVELVDEDAGGDPDSAAVEATLSEGLPFTSFAGVAQCVGGVVDGTNYDAGCRVLFAENNASGAVNLSLSWNSASDCSGSELGTVETTPEVDGSTAGFWIPSYAAFTAPKGAKSVLVSLVLFLENVTADAALFDGAILAPQGSVPLPLLINNFESGDLAGWLTSPP